MMATTFTFHLPERVLESLALVDPVTVCAAAEMRYPRFRFRDTGSGLRALVQGHQTAGGKLEQNPSSRATTGSRDKSLLPFPGRNTRIPRSTAWHSDESR